VCMYVCLLMYHIGWIIQQNL